MNDNANAPDFVWNPVRILEDHATFLVEEGQYETEDEAFEAASKDESLLEWEWECLLDALTERLSDINPGGLWYAEVSNFGWRRLSGYKEFQADDAKAFLQEILPRTECSFRIFIHDREIKIQNFHHDSPFGEEWYRVSPMSATEVEAA